MYIITNEVEQFFRIFEICPVRLFLEQYYIYSRIEIEVQRFLMFPLPPTCRACPISITHQNGSFFFFFNLHWHIIIIQSPWFPLGFTFAVVHLWVWTNVQWHISIIMISHRVFAPKILGALLVYPPTLQPKPLIFLLLPLFYIFQKVM